MKNIILGTWQVGGGSWSTVNSWKAYETLFCAIDQGIERIDTAPSYGDGHSEKIVGEVIRHFSNKALKVISKVPPDMMTRAKVIQSVEGSLTRLGVSQLDTLLIHWPAGTMGTDPVSLEETLRALELAKSSGLTKKIGVCNYDLADLETIDSLLKLDCLQYAYSLFFRGVEFGVSQFAEARGIELMGYSTLAQGILTDRPDYAGFSTDDHRNYVVLFAEKYRPHIQRMLQELRALLPQGVGLSNLAVSWVQSRGVTPILGLHTPDHLTAFSSGRISDDVLLDAADVISREFKAELGKRLSLWGDV
ncbi:aldo/keto reductase [Pseudomonas batumici]|uniref:Oxidoreductase, aldo/keto reductase family n=1 Tax=Pseudomonas batumici TaxID=226910 RepID=A0A0C2ECH4_9PSED|nr:aldo/keto reductase [Pseudomonas batumici]KIH83614.1 Oxidoreductase, aldo/keto reductase family [Pseudomonas batumici]